MNQRLKIFLIVTLIMAIPALGGLAQGKFKKKSSLPEIFGTAHTVFVETRDGDITDLRLPPLDRAAILDMQDAIEKWGRYSLSRSRLDADLILVLHRGADAMTPTNGNFPGPARTPASQTPMQDPSDASQASGASSPYDRPPESDQLRVYILQSNGKLKSPIWSGELEHGLDSPNLLLLQRLKAEVEKAYPSTPPSKSSTP